MLPAHERPKYSRSVDGPAVGSASDRRIAVENRSALPMTPEEGARGRTEPPQGSEEVRARFAIPEHLQRHRADWVEVDAVGVDGFWTWLESVLPLLPKLGATEETARPGEAPTARRVRELARDLVDCVGERARLTVQCAEYFRDNQLLARRLKALEATLRTVQRTGRRSETVEKHRDADVAERYLPR
jgi:hypothetical protein